MIIRMFPVVFSTLLFSAHLLRFYGWWPPALLMLTCLTLFIPNRWVLRGWQVMLLLFGLIWIKITITIILMRLEAGKPLMRLLLIMGAMVTINFLSLLATRNKTVRKFYHDL